MRSRTRILLSLLLGTVTSVAVAWTLALWPDDRAIHASGFRISSFGADPVRQLSMLHQLSPGRCRVQMTVNWDPQPPLGVEQWRLRPELGADIVDAMRAFPNQRGVPVEYEREVSPNWPFWPGWLPRIPETLDGLVSYGGRAAGWPLLALRSTADNRGPGPPTHDQTPLEWTYSWRLRSRESYPPAMDASPGTVPLMPIPLNFALNTLFYATIWWVLIGGPFDVRRWWRIRHNRCPRCAYSRLGLPDTALCPECGMSAARRSRA